MFDEALRQRAAEIEANWTAQNKRQAMRLGAHVDYLIEKNLLDDFVKWDQARIEKERTAQ